MNKIKLTVLIVVLGSLFLWSCSTGDTPAQEEEKVKTVNVETRLLKPERFERFIRLVGNVESEDDIRISAEVAGRVEEYLVDKGERVQKGETIAKIDDDQLQREKERLEAVTAQSRENYERLKKVYEEQGVGSEMEYLNAKYNYEQNQAALESVKVNLDKTTIKAPFDATLETKLVEVGEMVSPGMVMVRLIGANRLKVVAGVPARYSDVVSEESRASVWFDFESSDTLQLPIAFVGQSIDPDARTFRAEIALPPQTQNYKVDMVANVSIQTLQRDDVLVVNQEFIYQKEGGYVTYITGENTSGEPVALSRSVTLGPSYGNRVIIENGLDEGDELITVGSSFLQDSMRINIVDQKTQELAFNN